jgi:hypothetical protein
MVRWLDGWMVFFPTNPLAKKVETTKNEDLTLKNDDLTIKILRKMGLN